MTHSTCLRWSWAWSEGLGYLYPDVGVKISLGGYRFPGNPGNSLPFSNNYPTAMRVWPLEIRLLCLGQMREVQGLLEVRERPQSIARGPGQLGLESGKILVGGRRGQHRPDRGVVCRLGAELCPVWLGSRRGCKGGLFESSFQAVVGKVWRECGEFAVSWGNSVARSHPPHPLDTGLQF